MQILKQDSYKRIKQYTKDFSEKLEDKKGISAPDFKNDVFAPKAILGLNEKEIEFLKLACTEMTYKEIAEKMCLSPRTIDGYRDGLFEKLNMKSRVGLVVFAIRNGYFFL